MPCATVNNTTGQNHNWLVVAYLKCEVNVPGGFEGRYQHGLYIGIIQLFFGLLKILSAEGESHVRYNNLMHVHFIIVR